MIICCICGCVLYLLCVVGLCCSALDVAFLVDCTGSMDKSIAKIKLNIKAILEDLKEKILPHFEYRLAFVGYRDHSDGDGRIIKYDFGITSQTENFENFLENIEASGGGDECEDVFGGI